jgi:hypothetical protein
MTSIPVSFQQLTPSSGRLRLYCTLLVQQALAPLPTTVLVDLRPRGQASTIDRTTADRGSRSRCHRYLGRLPRSSAICFFVGDDTLSSAALVLYPFNHCGS